MPLIARFKRDHPKVALDVTLTERPVDLVADGFDIGIIVPYMVTSETTVVRLLERVPVVIVATPGYLQASSTPLEPSQLADHLFVPMSPSIRRPGISFRNGADELSVPLRFEVSSNSPIFNREMVLQGFGIGVVPKDLVDNDLASGKLVRLLADFELVDDSIEIWLAYSNRILLPAKVRAFIDHAAVFSRSRRPLAEKNAPWPIGARNDNKLMTPPASLRTVRRINLCICTPMIFATTTASPCVRPLDTSRSFTNGICPRSASRPRNSAF